MPTPLTAQKLGAKLLLFCHMRKRLSSMDIKKALINTKLIF